MHKEDVTAGFAGDILMEGTKNGMYWIHGSNLVLGGGSMALSVFGGSNCIYTFTVAIMLRIFEHADRYLPTFFWEEPFVMLKAHLPSRPSSSLAVGGFLGAGGMQTRHGEISTRTHDTSKKRPSQLDALQIPQPKHLQPIMIPEEEQQPLSVPKSPATGN